jgi:hypothetical protein
VTEYWHPTGWLPARVEWQDADADAALAGAEDEGWRAPSGESVLRWGQLAGGDPVPCAAVGFPWASVRPDRCGTSRAAASRAMAPKTGC